MIHNNPQSPSQEQQRQLRQMPEELARRLDVVNSGLHLANAFAYRVKLDEPEHQPVIAPYTQAEESAPKSVPLNNVVDKQDPQQLMKQEALQAVNDFWSQKNAA